MKKSLKIALGTIGILLGLIIVLPFLITWNQYKGLIEQKASDAAGRPVKINGNVRFGILPVPYALITDLVVTNPPGAASKQFATVKSIDVGVSLLPLLHKEIKVTHVDIKEPAITLEVMADGQNNWTFKPANAETVPQAAAQEANTSTTALSIDDISIDKGYVRYIDVPKKSQQVIGPIDGKFNVASLQGPISGKGTLTINDHIPVRFETKIDSLPVDANGVIPFSMNFDLMSGAAEASFKGQIQKGDAVGARVETALSIPDLEKILGATSKDGKTPDLPPYLKKKISITGLTTYKDSKAAIDNLMINSGGLEVSGSVNAVTSPSTTITIDLSRVVLPPEMTAASGIKSTGDSKPSNKNLAKQLEDAFQSASGILDTALPTSPVNLVLTATQLPLPNQMNFRDVRVAASMGAAGATIQTIEAKLAGNTVIKMTGELPARTDGKIASAKINANINSQSIEAAMGNAGEKQTPVNASGTIILSREDLRITPLQIVQNGQTVQADVIYNPKAADALGIAVKGAALNLDAFMGNKAKDAKGKDKTADATTEKSSSDPLAMLQGLKAKITADLGSVTYQGKTANKVGLNATLSDAGLQLQQASIGDLGGMVVQAAGKVGGFSPLKDVDIRAKATSPNLSQTLRALGNEAAQSLGASSFDVAVKGDNNAVNLVVNGLIDQGKIAIDAVAKQLNATPTFAGTVDITHPETATIVRNFGGLKPTTALGAFALKTKFAYGADTIKADDLVVKLGSAGTLTGDVNIAPQNGTRSINANLKADKLALAALTGESNETSSAQAEAKPVDNKGWSKEPINLDGLRNLNGQANVAIGELLYKKFVIKNFKTDVKFANNTINLNDFSGGLFDAGKFSINGQLAPGAQGQAHRGSFAITVADTDAKKLFEALGSKPFSEGKVNIAQKINFTGASQYDIVRSLDGDGSLKVTDGVVNGIDLDALAAKFDRPNSLSDFAAILSQATAGGQTKIGNLDAPINIRNGVGNLDNVTIKTQKTQMAMKGVVNLPEKTIDASGQITFTEQRNLPPLTLMMKGPMDAPAKSFDTRGLTQFYAQKATDKLQDKLQDKLGGKLNKLLGVPETTTPTPATPTEATPVAPATENVAPTAAPLEPTAVPVTPATEATPATAPSTAPAPAKSSKAQQKDELKQLGGQMLQNLLGGQQ